MQTGSTAGRQDLLAPPLPEVRAAAAPCRYCSPARRRPGSGRCPRRRCPARCCARRLTPAAARSGQRAGATLAAAAPGTLMLHADAAAFAKRVAVCATSSHQQPQAWHFGVGVRPGDVGWRDERPLRAGARREPARSMHMHASGCRQKARTWGSVGAHLGLGRACGLLALLPRPACAAPGASSELSDARDAGGGLFLRRRGAGRAQQRAGAGCGTHVGGGAAAGCISSSSKRRTSCVRAVRCVHTYWRSGALSAMTLLMGSRRSRFSQSWITPHPARRTQCARPATAQHLGGH